MIHVTCCNESGYCEYLAATMFKLFFLVLSFTCLVACEKNVELSVPKLESKAVAVNEPKGKDILAAIRRFDPSATLAVPDQSVGQFFAGDFTVSQEVLRRLGGGSALLSGDHLHLFPDQSYVFVEWADIMPETIFDKGTWRFDGEYIRLDTDNSVPPRYSKHDLTFAAVALTVRGVPQAVLLGVDRDFDCLKELAKEGSDFNLHICSRTRAIQTSDPFETKVRLMKTAWRPQFFLQ